MKRRARVLRLIGLMALLFVVSVGLWKLVEYVRRPKEIRAWVTDVPAVLSLAFSRDSRHVAVGSSSGAVLVVEVSGWTVVEELQGHGGPVSSIAFSPDGTVLATGAADGTYVWDWEKRAVVSTFTGHEGHVTSVAFSPDGTLLATGSADNSVRLWDVRAGVALRTLSGHHQGVTGVAFSPDGAYFASGSSDGLVHLWRVETGEEVASLSARQDDVASLSWADRYSHTLQSLAFSPDGGVLASGGSHRFWSIEPCGTPPRSGNFELLLGQVSLWAVPDGTRVRNVGWNGRTDSLDLLEHWGGITSVAYSPDGRFLAGGSDHGYVTVWNARTGREVIRWKAHERSVRAVAWSPDGRSLVSASDDGKLKLWHAGEALVF